MKNQDHLKHIFQKYLDNECSPAEVDELLAYFRTENNDDVLKKLILEKLESPVFQLTEDVQADAIMFDRIFSNISQKINAPDKNAHNKFRFYSWLAVAASLFIILTTSLYFYWGKNKAGSQVYNAKLNHNDVAPGGNKAMLTLSNGTVITLNDARNGQIAKQKGSIIKKAKDGQIVYHANTTYVKTNNPEINTITTPRGGQYMVVLPDGSKVWLNAASSLKFPVIFSGAERNVELTGEAYFEVAKNKLMPFKLKVNGATVEVLGTHFNVMAYHDEEQMKTTLLEGSVKISKGDKSDMLKPGQQASIGNGNNIQITTADTEQAMAWKNGYFKFNRDNIQTIMRQLSRWYDIDVVYDRNIPDDEFVGKIRRGVNVSEVLGVLALNHVHFKIQDKKIIVSNNDVNPLKN